MSSPRILDAGPSSVRARHTPVSARTGCEHGNNSHARAAGPLHGRLLVLDAQLAERERSAPGMAADPQHGHSEKVCEGRPTGNRRVRL
jgi:hypothetical protein